jgi:hypothetical protein
MTTIAPEIITPSPASNTTAGKDKRSTEQKSGNTRSPASTTTRPFALIATALLLLLLVLLAGSVLASSLRYASYYRHSEDSVSSVPFRPSSPSPPSCSLPLSRGESPPLLEASSGDATKITKIHNRIDSLEDRVKQHDVLLTSLETQMTELTEMVLKLSSCGAHFYKTKPEFDFSKAVQGQDISEALFVEGRTKICAHGRMHSKHVIPASPQCRYDVNDAVKVEENQSINHQGGGNFGGYVGSRGGNYGTGGDTMAYLNALRDRIAKLENGMEEIKSLLSTRKYG